MKLCLRLMSSELEEGGEVSSFTLVYQANIMYNALDHPSVSRRDVISPHVVDMPRCWEAIHASRTDEDEAKKSLKQRMIITNQDVGAEYAEETMGITGGSLDCREQVQDEDQVSPSDLARFAVTVYIYTYASPLFLRPSLVPVAVTPDIRLAFGKLSGPDEAQDHEKLSGVLPLGAPESVVYDIVALSGGGDQAPAERLLHAERLCKVQRRS
ncbi:hypothetical protein KC331_g41 [Hortaea werneckii]|nr:hypothetical protein KC331_g41 [Hortaea werneckii]